MSLRLLLVLTVLLAGSCTNDPNKKGAIDAMEHRHAEDTLRGGGGGGGGGGSSGM